MIYATSTCTRNSVFSASEHQEIARDSEPQVCVGCQIAFASAEPSRAARGDIRVRVHVDTRAYERTLLGVECLEIESSRARKSWLHALGAAGLCGALCISH